eukprot:5589137-Alexandrium_andersonii.AAC.1
MLQSCLASGGRSARPGRPANPRPSAGALAGGGRSTGPPTSKSASCTWRSRRQPLVEERGPSGSALE